MKKIYRYPLMLLGAVMMGFAVKCIYNPANLVTGGFAGLAVLADRMFNIPLWITNVVLNFPLFIATAWILGKRMIARSLFATGVYSVVMAVLPDYALFPNDIFLSCIMGGLLMGVGIGIILALGATSGGVDLLATLIHHFTPRFGVTWIMFAIDGIIILLGALRFGPASAVYAVMSVFIVSFISEKIIDGPGYAKAALIITSKQDEIADVIMTRIGRGVTGINGKGMFSDKDRVMLYCIASRSEMVKIRELVHDMDPQAFMTISSVTEVIGEGFVKN